MCVSLAKAGYNVYHVTLGESREESDIRMCLLGEEMRKVGIYCQSLLRNGKGLQILE